MQCSKEFSISIAGSCSGLALDAPWTLPGPTDPTTSYDYDFEGYHGVYFGDQPVAGGGAVIGVTHRLEYTRIVAGGNVRITHTLKGTVDMTGVANPCNFVIRAYSNGTFQDVNQFCPANSGVNVINLTATATGAVILNNVLYVLWINNDRAPQAFAATVEVECL